MSLLPSSSEREDVVDVFVVARPVAQLPAGQSVRLSV